jgi:hypothetical protein
VHVLCTPPKCAASAGLGSKGRRIEAIPAGNGWGG